MPAICLTLRGKLPFYTPSKYFRIQWPERKFHTTRYDEITRKRRNVTIHNATVAAVNVDSLNNELYYNGIGKQLRQLNMSDAKNFPLDTQFRVSSVNVHKIRFIVGEILLFHLTWYLTCKVPN